MELSKEKMQRLEEINRIKRTAKRVEVAQYGDLYDVVYNACKNGENLAITDGSGNVILYTGLIEFEGNNKGDYRDKIREILKNVKGFEFGDNYGKQPE